MLVGRVAPLATLVGPRTDADDAADDLGQPGAQTAFVGRQSRRSLQRGQESLLSDVLRQLLVGEERPCLLQRSVDPSRIPSASTQTLSALPSGTTSGRSSWVVT